MGLDQRKLETVIVSALELAPEQYSAELAFGHVGTWDSLGHVNLIFSVEEEFGVKFDSTEIPNLKSVRHIQRALEKRLG